MTVRLDTFWHGATLGCEANYVPWRALPSANWRCSALRRNSLHGAPLLVTEVFLPEILSITKST